MEKQLRLTFEAAAQKTGDAGKNFLRALEMRLDNVVYRAGLATSRAQARQLVNHGQIVVNDKKADTPSFVVKVGQTVKVKPNRVRGAYFKNLAAGEKLKKAAPTELAEL